MKEKLEQSLRTRRCQKNRAARTANKSKRSVIVIPAFAPGLNPCFAATAFDVAVLVGNIVAELEVGIDVGPVYGVKEVVEVWNVDGFVVIDVLDICEIL